MMDMTKEEIKKLLDEDKSLNILKDDVDLLVEKLRAEQDLIKQTVAKMQTWKSGNGSDAFKGDMQDYFEDFTKHTDDVDKTHSSIDSAIFNIRLQISNLQNIGPKL